EARGGADAWRGGDRQGRRRGEGGARRPVADARGDEDGDRGTRGERRRGGRGARAAGAGGGCQGSAGRSALTFVNAPLRAALYPSGGLPVPAAGSLLVHVSSDNRVRRFGCAAGVAALALLLLQLPEARAADPPGLYLGGAFGQARVDAPAPLVGQVKEDHSAFKIIVGLRPISLLGAELAYADFGHTGRL